MKNKIPIAFILAAALIFSTLAFAIDGKTGMQPPSGGQQPPTGGQGDMQPPSGGEQPNGDNSKPMKERLEEFMNAKQQFIDAKKQCKENAVKTNAEKGTCWTELRPMMIKILMNELALTHERLVQLKEQNITFDNIEEINTKLQEAKAVFEDETSDKATIKAAAKSLEEIIVSIEDEATKGQPEVLLKQMDTIIGESEKLIPKLEGMLEGFKAKGVDTADLESDLEQFKSDVKDAKDIVADAKSKYKASSSSEDVYAALKEVRIMINDAKKQLEKAFDTVKAMISNMNQQQGQGGSGGNQDSRDGQQGGESQ